MTLAGACGGGDSDSNSGDAAVRILVRAEGSSRRGLASTRVTPEFHPEKAWWVDWKVRCDDGRHDSFELAVLDPDNATVAHATSRRASDAGRLDVTRSKANFRLRVTSECTFSADAMESTTPL